MLLSKANLLVLLVTLASARPQGGDSLASEVAALPSCATSALISVLNLSKCQATDTDCLCSYPNIQAELSSVVAKVCESTSDQQAVAAFARGFCPTTSPTTTTTAATLMVTSISSASGSEHAAATATTKTENGTAIVYPIATGGTTSPDHTTNASAISTSSPTPTSDLSTGAAAGSAKPAMGLNSMFAWGIAVAGLTWAFAEL